MAVLATFVGAALIYCGHGHLRYMLIHFRVQLTIDNNLNHTAAIAYFPLLQVHRQGVVLN